MAEGTCSEVDCERAVWARDICRRCYYRLKRSGRLPAMDGAWHRLSDVDEEARRATCSQCGPVRIRIRTRADGKRFICGTVRRGAQRSPEATARQRRAWRMRSKYGLTPAEVLAMRARQGGACGICKQVVDLVIDHDHSTGRVRALLCRTCNLALGYLRDDPSLADAAAQYLRAH